jgi:uncharacterized protein (TIGR02466 family)
MAINTFFPTSIYYQNLGLEKLRKELLEQCELVRQTDPEGRKWSQENYPSGYTSYGSITDLHRRYPHFEELGHHLDRHVQKFARHLEMDLQGGCLELTSLWVNIMPKNAAHSLHLHPNSVISGTYYVSVPKGSSSIKFEDPRLSMMMGAPPKQANPKARNQQFVTLEPKGGHIALWESWLRHEVPRNESSQTRVSISFNYEWH